MPPFPDARPLARPRLRGDGDIVHRAEPALLAARIAEAKVGGDFWGQARPTMAGGSAAASAPADPGAWDVIEREDRIVAPVGSELALLAAAAGKAVYTPDSGLALDREASLHALQRHVASYSYFDPWSGQPIDAQRWIEILAEWRRLLDANRDIAFACGIARWKRPTINRFLWCGTAARFANNCAPAQVREPAVAVWPSRVPERLPQAVRESGKALIQIEDGFLRSSGLGVRLNPPFSIVADRRGIYYDPSCPSDLEHILANHELGPELCERAERLMRSILSHRLTKYALAASGRSFVVPSGVRRILVAGQVADDRSVHLGCAGIAGPIGLLKRVRAAEPDAFIIYKPHPDVVAGLRKGHVPGGQARHYVDLILTDVPLDPLLRAVDAVHVLTSLTGFEALLRGREVVTHGQPFYAGWGLTRDLAPPIARRGRRLSLAQLVAATLILYPRYLDPVTRLPCPPEILIERLSHGDMPRTGFLQRLRSMQGSLHNAGRRLAAIRP